ncbi:oligosaccharide flippase family protein [Candidatus Daviesbacteria bacterium]|nr:oligosaccharide flippase family protein [Candidatus Daviesbacteria bacterium]
MEILRKVFQQTSYQILGKVVNSLATLFILGFIARFYGEDGTGVFTLALTFLSFFYLASDLGLNAIVLPRLKSSPNEANKLFNFRLIWSLVLVVGSSVVAFLLPLGSDDFKLAVLFGSLTITGMALYNSFNLIFQYRLKYNLSVIASSLDSLVQIPLIIALGLMKLPVYLLNLGLVLGDLMSNTTSFILIKKFYRFKLEVPSFLYIKGLLLVSWPISLTLVLNSLYFRIDTFILSFYHGISSSGNYNLAYQVFQNILVIPTFIMNGFYPLMVQSFSFNKIKFFKEIKLAGVILFLISILASLVIFTLADLVIKIIANSGFQPASLSLKILSLSFPAYFLSSLLMWVFLTLKEYKSLALIYAFGLIINIFLNLVFIPSYSFIAASAITGISEYLILFLLLTILYFKFKDEINS